MIKVIYEDEAMGAEFPEIYTEIDFAEHISWTSLAKAFVNSLPRYGYFVDIETMEQIGVAIDEAGEEQHERHYLKPKWQGDE